MTRLFPSKELQIAGDRIRAGRDRIITLWEKWARESIPEVSRQTSLALRDHLPIYLEYLSHSLQSINNGSLSQSPESQEVIQKHSIERANILKGYTLDQVITEYSLLREATFDFLYKEMTLPAESTAVLHHLFDEAIRLAACAFAEIKSNESKVEKEVREIFVATLSHDLRNPLAAAKANAQMIVRYPDKADRHITFASRIVESIDRADKMISDLLDANWIQAGQTLPLDIKFCDFKFLVESCTEEQNIIYGPRFSLALDNDVKGYWAIEELRRVLINLISNAVKYGLPHSPISISLRQNSTHTILDVHNVGSFIPVNQREIIFRAFNRLGNAERSGHTGWGIGLTLVRGIIEAHHGKVEVISDETGTTFTVTLPNDSRVKT